MYITDVGERGGGQREHVRERARARLRPPHARRLRRARGRQRRQRVPHHARPATRPCWSESALRREGSASSYMPFIHDELIAFICSGGPWTKPGVELLQSLNKIDGKWQTEYLNTRFY